MDFGTELGKPLLLSIVFTVVGIIIFGIAIWVIDRVTPFSLRKEIEEDQNVALAIVVGSMILGIAIILASTLIDLSFALSINNLPGP